jgi:hypothetical protein
MSATLSAAAQQQFDSEVKHAFQSSGKLRDTVTIRNGVVADIYKFRAMGKGLANQKATSADVVAMGVSHSLISCTLANWNAPEYTDIFDSAEVLFDERQELAQTIAGALGRRLDQLILDALDAATPAASIASGSAALTLTKIIQTGKELNDKGVPSGDRHFVTSAAGMEDLLGDSTITSADYNNVRALMAGDIDTFMGFKFHTIESRTEGGLDVVTAAGVSTREGFGYHKSALGLAVGIDLKTEVNYVAQKTSWLCNGLMKAGAVARDGNGIVSVKWVE